MIYDYFFTNCHYAKKRRQDETDRLNIFYMPVLQLCL